MHPSATATERETLGETEPVRKSTGRDAPGSRTADSPSCAVATTALFASVANMAWKPAASAFLATVRIYSTDQPIPGIVPRPNRSMIPPLHGPGGCEILGGKREPPLGGYHVARR